MIRTITIEHQPPRPGKRPAVKLWLRENGRIAAKPRVLPLRQAALYLQALRYRYQPGTNGIWLQQAA